MADEKLIIQIDLDDKKLKASTNKALKGIKDTAASEGREIQTIFQKSFTGIGRQMNMLKVQFAGIFTGIAVIQAIRALSDFERQLIAVGKTTNFTDKQLKAFGTSMVNLSKKIPVTTDELLKISEVAGQMGINDAKQLSKFVETVSRLGVSVSGISTEELSLQLARLIELTGGSLKDVDRLGSSLVALGNNFKVNEGQIAKVSLEVSKIAGIYGVSAKDVLGFSTAIAQSGVEAEVARTTFLTLFDKIGSAVSKGGTQLTRFTKQTGLTTDEFKDLAKNDPSKLILRLAESFKGLDGDGVAINNRLKELGISEKRVRTGFSALITTSDTLREALALSTEEFDKNTALLEESESAFKGLGRQFTRFGNNLKAIGLELSGNLTKNMAEFLRRINDLLAIDGLSKKIENFITTLARLGAIFVSIKSAGAILSLVGTIKSIVTVSIGAGTALNTLGLKLIFASKKAKLAAIGVKAFTTAVKASKIAITLGLSLAIDGVIQKFTELANLSPLQKVNKQIQDQVELVARLNTQLEAGGKEIQTRFGSTFVGFTDDEKAKLEADIVFAQEKIAQLGAEASKLTPPEPQVPQGGEEARQAGLETGKGFGDGVQEGLEFSKDAITLSLDSIFKDFNKFQRSVKVTSKDISQTLTKGMAAGASNAFSSMGKAIANGENAFEALGKSVLSSLGSMLSQLGQSFILQGIAHSANPLTPGIGGPMIAAGAALSLFGGVLGGLGGGGAKGGGEEPASNIDEIEEPTIDPEDLEEKQAQVVVNVEGTVLDPQAVGLQISEILNESGYGSGAVVA